MKPQQRAILYALVAMVLVWLAAIGGHAIFKASKMTAEKLRAYLEQTDLHRLSGEARAKALRDLATKINALSAEERQQARLGRLWERWFAEMTENEKAGFLEATLPTGFKQMMASFESLAPERRQKTVENAVKRMRESRDNPQDGSDLPGAAGTNAPPMLSEDLQKKVAMIGIKSVYGNSSAQTKAELAPLLEELQRSMETGRMLRGGGR